MADETLAAATSRMVRAEALGLAVETVKSTRNFTNFQVVHTAKLYEDYIMDGSVPPQPSTAPVEAQEVTDEPV